MKRILTLMLAAALGLTTFSACVDDNPNKNNSGYTSSYATDAAGTSAATETPSTPATPAPVVETAPAAGGEIRTGLGIVTDVGDSRAASETRGGNVMVESTIAAVTLDADGVITKITLDAAQTRVDFDGSGTVTSDLAGEFQTKTELRDGYNMRGYSGIEKEWYEQAAGFEAWCVGKTPAQVAGIKTNGGVPDEADLTASVTIDVSHFVEAVQKAVANARPATADAGYKTGLGVVTDIGGSRNAGDGSDGQGQVASSIAAITVDASGKIVALTIDNAQTTVRFDNTGAFTTDLNAPISSKLELLDGYNMRGASAISKEWYEQADAFSEWAVGKTVAEVTGMKTKEKDASHPAVPDEPDLAASVSINVSEIVASVAKAAANAR